MRIRPMTTEDVERVMAIASGLQHAPQWRRESYLAALKPGGAPPRIALFAEEEKSGRVAGFVIASVVPPEGELETIAVERELQRQRVASGLFSALRQELRARQVARITLEVRASNHPAVAFYQSLGFVQTGRRPGYYADPVEDAVIMGLNLLG